MIFSSNFPRSSPPPSNRTKREVHVDDEMIIEPYQRTTDTMTQLLYVSRIIDNYEENLNAVHAEYDAGDTHRSKRDTSNRVDNDIDVRFQLVTE